MRFISESMSCFLTMTREIRSTRPARAAIAAVLAFSATPLLAQEVAPLPVAPVPMTPAVEPAAPPVAPVMEAAPPAPAASAPVMAPAQPVVQSTPSVEERKAEAIAQAEAASAEAASAEAVSAEAAPAPVQPVQKRPAARAAAPTPAPAQTVAAAPVRAMAPAPVEATPVAPDMAASTPVEPAAVTPPVANDVAQVENGNEALTWGLAGGALLLVGAVGTMAMRRRRNRAGESAYRVDEGVSEGIVTVPETALAREPAFTPVAPVTTAKRAPLTADAPHGSLAALVDAPPSQANPFLTRGNRLRRAHFLLAQQAGGSQGAGMAAATVAPQATPVDRSQTVYRFGKEDARRSGLIPRTR